MELNREVIKALECCYDNNLSCIDCPFQDPNKYFECSNLTNYAVALVKELTEENKRLKKSEKVMEYDTPWGKTTISTLLHLESKTAEVYNKIKADTVRKMQERLTTAISAIVNVSTGEKLVAFIWCLELVDHIAKEMIKEIN